MTKLFPRIISLFCLLIGLKFANSRGHDHPDLIDLWYAKHIPTFENTTSANATLLSYNNIRYAEPPLGWKRFRKPQTPPPYQHKIQNGDLSSWETDCLSSAPVGVPFPLLSGLTWGSEDCLFLNVVVPKGVKEGDKVPVLHWVVGSAYAFGGKDWVGFGLNAYGLFNQPLNLTDRFIIVTHNYRLGVPGWLPKLDEDMNGNLGVWDTLAAVEWTKKYIHKFGGDPENITVFGQSAGAAIITWLLLAREGNMVLPFQQAWVASPTIAPRKNLERSRPLFDEVLNFTGCHSVECMRQLPASTMRDVNKHILIESTSGPGGGSLGFGVGLTPTIDGELVSDLPVNTFAAGKFNKKVKVVVGNTMLEGLGLSSDRNMPNRFAEIVRANLPNVTNESIALLQSLYPYSPELPEYLAWAFITDIIWTCTVTNIAHAYGDKARRFLFSVPPSTHGLDLSYFFFADNSTTPVVSLKTAYAAESTLLQYMFRRDFPSNPKALYAGPISEWKSFAENGTIANITVDGFEFALVGQDLIKRCETINELIRDPLNGV
ncbi:lipase [Amniculicola lignicola CBS 123094]|uniref:Carboxylic ester hydrolase n=1 Tax=Amniculicola lignicola CBS 123094 TaxID=1392246 RepID=A0A6A5W039_9PLEO|nr:lipase [Amniculicola lignicola CBS 123094]